MDQAELFARIDEIEGQDRSSSQERNRQLARDGRWGTCVDCPRDRAGHRDPASCRHTRRYDHHIEIQAETARLLMVYQRSKYRNAGHYFYETGEHAVPPDGRPGGRWAVVDYAGVTRLRTRSLAAARRYAGRSYIAGVVRRWHGQAVSHG